MNNRFLLTLLAAFASVALLTACPSGDDSEGGEGGEESASPVDRMNGTWTLDAEAFVEVMMDQMEVPEDQREERRATMMEGAPTITLVLNDDGTYSLSEGDGDDARVRTGTFEAEADGDNVSVSMTETERDGEAVEEPETETGTISFDGDSMVLQLDEEGAPEMRFNQ